MKRMKFFYLFSTALLLMVLTSSGFNTSHSFHARSPGSVELEAEFNEDLGSSIQSGLRIEQNIVFKTILSEMEEAGSRPEAYLLADQYRLDLTLIDLIDQVTIVALDFDQNILKQLSTALGTQTRPDFFRWWKELKKITEKNSAFEQKLNARLYLQFYSYEGVALIPEYRMFDVNKIKDNPKLVRITEYNKFAAHADGPGLLGMFERTSRSPFFTNQLTVAKLKLIKKKELKEVKKNYFKKLIALYTKHGGKHQIKRTRKGLRVIGDPLISENVIRVFNLVHSLPNKNQVLTQLSKTVPIPVDSGVFVLTPEFMEKNFQVITDGLKDMTLQQILRSHDDEYLLSVRKYIEKNSEKIQADLIKYNQENDENFKLVWGNRDRRPRRLEAIANLDALLKLYPEGPWHKDEGVLLIKANGKESFTDRSLIKRSGKFFQHLGKEFIQPENYLSLLGGTAVLAIAPGNIPLAMSTKKILKQAIETKRYDKEWDEFLRDAPKEVLNTLLLSSGFGAGRFYKILALGSAQGAIQSVVTGQNVATGAGVGAGINLFQYYILPPSIGRPTSKGFGPKDLARNKRLEVLERAVKGSVQGSVVAAIDGEDIRKGALKGLGYGALSAPLLIWVFGVRYNPLRDWSEKQIDDMIKNENDFQNLVGRGGEYKIDRQLILDAQYRVNGQLPEWIRASITLPGNVSMHSRHFSALEVMTHEAHHLMQQEQSGVFGFYLLRYLPTSFKHGYEGHPDENFWKP